jgi:acetylornithine deacetylase/succinyl-diaminopimelate desuccinylase-like protein
MTERLDDKETSELLDLVKELIKIPSSQKEGREVYEFVKSYLEDKGLKPKFQSIENPYVEYHDFSNLYLKIGNGNGPKIMINCHLDTVSTKGEWFHPPYSAREEDGRIYGLGAADMKAGCSAAIYSLIALLKRKEKPNGELFLSCVFGEEAPFSLGADTLLREHNIRDYDLIILTEPSPLLAINDYCVTHKRMHKNLRFPVVIVGAEGRVAIEIEFFGKSSHASHPSQGVNALHDAAKVISKLVEFDLFSNIKMGRGHYVVLRIEGGDQSFTVPGYCKILINRQLILGEDSKTVMREIKKILRSLNLKSKINIAKRYSPSPEVEYQPYLFDKDEFIDRFMNRLPSGKYGDRCKMTSSSVGDNNLFAVRTKVPTMVFGPGGGNIHAPNEFVNIDEIIQTTNYLLDFYLEVF